MPWIDSPETSTPTGSDAARRGSVATPSLPGVGRRSVAAATDGGHGPGSTDSGRGAAPTAWDRRPQSLQERIAMHLLHHKPLVDERIRALQAEAARDGLARAARRSDGRSFGARALARLGARLLGAVRPPTFAGGRGRPAA
jgi:hypothetical protein